MMSITINSDQYEKNSFSILWKLEIGKYRSVLLAFLHT